jgi:hypothetical protein
VTEHRLRLKLFIDNGDPMMHQLCDHILPTLVASLKMKKLSVGVTFTEEHEPRVLPGDGPAQRC